MGRFRVAVLLRIHWKGRRRPCPDEASDEADSAAPHLRESPATCSTVHSNSSTDEALYLRTEASGIPPIQTHVPESSIRRLRTEATRRMSAALSFRRSRDLSDIASTLGLGQMDTSVSHSSADVEAGRSSVDGMHVSTMAHHCDYDLQAPWQVEVADPFAKAPPITVRRPRTAQAAFMMPNHA